MYCKDNKPFEGLVSWMDWKETHGDDIVIIYWDHIDDMNKCGKFSRNMKHTDR